MKQIAKARWVNIVVGAWLAASALLWPHTLAQLANAALVGCACVVVAAVALRIPQARFVNTALGLWLYVSTWFLPAEVGTTVWNHALVSLVMMLIALVPSPRELERQTV
jgi:hypothetical protein